MLHFLFENLISFVRTFLCYFVIKVLLNINEKEILSALLILKPISTFNQYNWASKIILSFATVGKLSLYRCDSHKFAFGFFSNKFTILSKPIYNNSWTVLEFTIYNRCRQITKLI